MKGSKPTHWVCAGFDLAGSILNGMLAWLIASVLTAIWKAIRTKVLSASARKVVFYAVMSGAALAVFPIWETTGLYSADMALAGSPLAVVAYLAIDMSFWWWVRKFPGLLYSANGRAGTTPGFSLLVSGGLISMNLPLMWIGTQSPSTSSLPVHLLFDSSVVSGALGEGLFLFVIWTVLVTFVRRRLQIDNRAPSTGSASNAQHPKPDLPYKKIGRIVYSIMMSSVEFIMHQCLVSGRGSYRQACQN